MSTRKPVGPGLVFAGIGGHAANGLLDVFPVSVTHVGASGPSCHQVGLNDDRVLVDAIPCTREESGTVARLADGGFVGELSPEEALPFRGELGRELFCELLRHLEVDASHTHDEEDLHTCGKLVEVLGVLLVPALRIVQDRGQNLCRGGHGFVGRMFDDVAHLLPATVLQLDQNGGPGPRRILFHQAVGQHSKRAALHLGVTHKGFDRLSGSSLEVVPVVPGKNVRLFLVPLQQAVEAIEEHRIDSIGSGHQIVGCGLFSKVLPLMALDELDEAQVGVRIVFVATEFEQKLPEFRIVAQGVSLKRGAKVFKRSNPALPVSLPGLIEALVGFCIGSQKERRFLFGRCLRSFGCKSGSHAGKISRQEQA